VGSGGDGGQATSAQLYFPEGVAVDASGTVYISDTGNNRIRKVDPSGVISILVSVPHPRGIAVDSGGTVYVADSDHNRIWRVSGSSLVTFAGTGVAGYSGDGHAASSAQLNGPWGVAVDSNGNVYIADTNNNVVRRVDHATGVITTIAGTGVVGAGGDGRLAVNAQLSGPAGVAVDGTGRVFIADSDNQRVRMVGGQGVIQTVVGTCSASPGFAGDGGPMAFGQLNYPLGLAVDSTGDILIADVDNNRVRAAVAPIVTGTVACQSPPGTPGPRGASQSTTRTGPPRIPERAGATIAPVADQAIRAPAIPPPAMAKTIQGQSESARPVTATGNSAVSNATVRGDAVEPPRTGTTTHGRALRATATGVNSRGGIPIAGAFLPLLLTVIAVALMRLRRKRKAR
ncbi:MAG TPA: hypothetical protein VHO95_12265, partial [Candidatus Dormibacteraeota bacterium]|nr:hypothetical protein [Candidatus Dormibacteraeota bacterium]